MTRGTRKKCDCSAPVDNMSDKTELLIVEVEKHPILIRERGREKEKCVETYCAACRVYCVLYKGWFVRTFERIVARKDAKVAFVVVVVLCINRPLK